MQPAIDALGLGALGLTAPKEYKFYNGTVTMQYDDVEHSYTRYDESGLVRIPGVTTVVHIIDKSGPLTQWAANMTTEYIRAKLAAHGLLPCSACGSCLDCLRVERGGAVKTLTVEEVESWLNDARFNFKEYADKAADTGHQAHGWLEQYIRADKRNDHAKLQLLLAAMPTDERAKNGVIAALDFMQKHKIKWLYTERKIYSRKYDFAGTMDGLAYVSSCGDAACTCCGYVDLADGKRKAREFENVLSIVDWKTSNRLYEEFHFQTAAYLAAHAEEFPAQTARYRFITRLGKEDAEFEARLLLPDTFDLDFQTYLQCLDLYRSIELGKKIAAKKKGAVKAAVKAAKEAELRIACKKSDTFKGTRFPKCNDGPPCQKCLAKYVARHEDKADLDVVIAASLSSTGTGAEL